MSHAYGKVILLGEHAVVHGTAALAVGIRRGVSARCAPADRDEIVVDGTKLPPGHLLLEALGALREALGAPPCALHLESSLPPEAGLGSSAAMAVASARALLASGHGLGGTEEAVFEAAQAWERIFHGTPSGIDVAAAQSGGAIRFVRGAAPRAIQFARPLRLVVARAGPPASTKAMIERVASHRQRNPHRFHRTLEAIGNLVDEGTTHLEQDQLAAVGERMNENHRLLGSWDLSTPDIERACHTARSAGALGAKVTGAGGGGCVGALAEGDEDQARILEALLRLGIPAFCTTVEPPSNRQIHSGGRE